ncbi:MAG TPA: CBS domain-containing protein [Acetobacteraceae bacterium]|nr:CBS domain-containing protein [Acetobacteraceae bacterium]
MKAADVMTRDVVTVHPETPVPDLVKLLLARGISGAPVVDKDGVLVGMVTEGDLVRRAELGTEKRRGGWAAFFTGTAVLAREYVQSHGVQVNDIMTQGAAAVAPETPLAEVADTMEQRRVRRVPVVENGRVVGVVSRANLLRAWASMPAVPTAPGKTDDTAIRDALLAELAHQAWSRRPENSVVVTDGVVHLWGLAGTEEEKRALELAASRTAGVKGVESHLVVLTAEPYPLLLGA